MNLVVLSEAEHEASQTSAWYESKQNGLGNDFLNELETAFQTILANPIGQPLLESSESTEAEFRRCLLKRFPYLVIFTIREEEILVVAVAHARRKPGYWMDRVS